ncbi:MAG: hypothetical protein RL347_2095 [Actinomycetota bacterium]|jgi:hypothetical protein
MRALVARSRPVAAEAFRLLALLDAGMVRPVPLRDFGKTGDLSDCGKIVIALEGYPEHRIVVRDVNGSFTVTEVIAIEDRTQDLPYLLAGVRLGRLEDPIRRSDALRRISRIRRLRDSEDPGG